MARKRITVISESKTGRNTKFLDNNTNTAMTRSKFVKEIKAGEYTGYHVRNVNGVATPVSNPDGKKGNNLG